jgi:predicted enzyme related to lactoylglutathione lyase
MRGRTALVCLVAFLTVACGSTTDRSEKSTSTNSTTSTSQGEATTIVPTTLTVDMASPPAATGSADPNASGKILMIKLPVGDVDAAEKFYGTLFGATSAAAMGAGIHIVTFPEGGPGLVLLQNDSEPLDDNKQGAFIIQVPDLTATKALALANGATEQGTFAGTPNGQAARSVDLLDPWGNQIEILQLG